MLLFLALAACKSTRPSGDDDDSSGDSTADSGHVGDSAPYEGPASSLLFHGSGRDNVDRVRIDRDTGTPMLDVGAGDFTVEFFFKGAEADNRAPALSCGSGHWNRGNVVFDAGRKDSDGFGLSFGAGKVGFGVNVGPQDALVCGGSSLLDGAWHHIAAQRSADTGKIWLFVDGEIEGVFYGPTGDVSYPDGEPPAATCGEAGDAPCVNDPYLVLSAEKHDLGRDNPSFAGQMDELRISTMLRYDAPFTPPRLPFVEDGQTAGLYHFDEAAGAVLGDSSDNGTDGELLIGGAPQGPEWVEDTPFGQ
ncbi:MAG: LamG domain-containing protein [Proteobacteria bacterium]|nr:LamG domain-containing protein [Pseudomonadota bacterium]MCP4920956.1 LamG domain-containing protein [Pseudomonadota bacterium]